MIRGRLLSVLVVAIVLLGFAFWGCAKKPAETAVTEEAPVVQLEEGEAVLKVEVTAEVDRHVVKKGECLWWIAEYKDIYNDPFQWPLIYDANKDQIRDPDLIYPGQVFKIPRSGYTMEKIKEARRSAGAPRPYTPPAQAYPPID
ncbi:MAG: LysM peptidoglycan-binding domain-containing protein [Proteobacteria bacterium]|nr:LysM peptidoglycan-binding domain-containing protein [Pseudomonadota bacterium]